MGSRRQRGYTMLELGIGVSLVLMGTATALAVASGVQRQARTNGTVDGIALIISNTKQLRAGTHFGGITIAELAAAGGVPAGWYDAAANQAAGPWGGRVWLVPMNFNGTLTAPNAFSVRVDVLDQQMCKMVARRFASQAYYMTATGGDIQITNLVTPVLATEATINAGCSAVNNQNYLYMSFDGGA